MLCIWISHYVSYYHPSQIIHPLRSFKSKTTVVHHVSYWIHYLHPKSVPPITFYLIYHNSSCPSYFEWRSSLLYSFFNHMYISPNTFCRFYFRKSSWVSCVCFMPTVIALVHVLINSHLGKLLIYPKKYLLSSYYVPVNILVTEAMLMNPINIKPTIYW